MKNSKILKNNSNIYFVTAPTAVTNEMFISQSVVHYRNTRDRLQPRIIYLAICCTMEAYLSETLQVVSSDSDHDSRLHEQTKSPQFD